MSLRPEALKPFDPKDLEEIYAYWPRTGWGYYTPKEIVEKFMHPASSTDNPFSPMFIARRDKRPEGQLYVNLEGRGSYGYPGFDFLNKAAKKQFSDWRTTMHNNEWWGEDYDSIPITRSSEALAEYCLAYWANAIQEGSMGLSLHASYKEHAKSAGSYPYGFISLNGHEFPRFRSSNGQLGLELRDVTSALLGGFGVSPDDIPHNLDAPFPRLNVWDIPGGKMIVVPEDCECECAGVRAIRLLPNKTIERLQATAKVTIEESVW